MVIQRSLWVLLALSGHAHAYRCTEAAVAASLVAMTMMLWSGYAVTAVRATWPGPRTPFDTLALLLGQPFQSMLRGKRLVVSLDCLRLLVQASPSSTAASAGALQDSRRGKSRLERHGSTSEAVTAPRTGLSMVRGILQRNWERHMAPGAAIEAKATSS